MTECVVARGEYVMEKHITYPKVIGKYVQLCFNIYLVVSALFIYRNFLDMIGNDISKKISFYRETQVFRIDSCSKNYLENKCFGKDHLPALSGLCQEWDDCTRYSFHDDISSSTVVAKIIADTLNTFFEHLAYKTVAIVCIGTFTGIVSLNIGLVYIR